MQVGARSYRVWATALPNPLDTLPPLTPEQLERQRQAIDDLRALREKFRGRGPSLQEILDEMHREQEERAERWVG